MSNNLVSQQLSMPGNQMAELEPVSSELDAPMSMGLMGFGTNESLQQQITSNMPIGQMGSVSNDFGLHLSSISNQQVEPVEPQVYAQLSHQYSMSNNPVGEIIPTMPSSISSHQLPTLNKRKVPMEPFPPNSISQKFPLPNKRVAHLEHSRPWLQLIPNRRTVELQSVSNSSGSLPSPASNKRSLANKSGSSASKNQPTLMRRSPKVQTEPFESVRSKMRESLAGALSLVFQKHGENAIAEKNSNGEAPSSPRKTDDGCHSVDFNCSADENNSETTQALRCNEQQFQQSNNLPDVEVPFSDNIFARDELLQGNGLSWVLEPEIDATKKKEIETVGKQNPVEEVGNDDIESFQSPQELSYRIEAELFKLFGGVNKKYKEKGRSLLFNLKDRNNPELRERVVSGDIPPERLCSMSAEELASKELSEWRQAKAEELAQMVVLPDVEVDIRRLVRKTHKGEFQVDFEQTDSNSVEVSAGTSIVRRPRTEAKQAPTTGRTVAKKDGSNTAGEKNNLDDPDLTITIPSSEGPDPMQGLMGEDELKDADFLPPIVSLDEFMKSLDTEPPFENLPGDARKTTSTSDKDDSEAGSDSKSSRQALQDHVDTVPEKPGSIDASKPKSDSDVKPDYIPKKIETVDSVATSKSEHVWEGTLQLNITSITSVICTFKSGEKTSTKEWPSFLEIKGRVRLDAFEKFLQELPKSRSRAVMVNHFVCKEESTESERGSLVEAADSYISDGRVGYAEPASGIELYLCPPNAKTLEMLSRIVPKHQFEALNAIHNGLIGAVVWRKGQLISPNSATHHKQHNSKKQYSTSRRHQEEDTNVNDNFPPKPILTHAGPPPPPADNDDDDDDAPPPGFGLPFSKDEDDLPEFNFSGSSNPSAGYQSQRAEMTSVHLRSQTSSRSVDVRELIQKYGQSSTNPPHGISMRQWNDDDDDDDDDDIPEWQPQNSQQQLLQPPPSQFHRFQQPMHGPQQLSHQALSSMHVQGLPNAAQSWQQQGTWWVSPHGSQGQQSVSGAQFYGTPGWRKDAPNSRGF